MRRMDHILIFDILGLVLVLAEEAILDLRKVTNWLEHGRIILRDMFREYRYPLIDINIQSIIIVGQGETAYSAPIQ